jgi:hypothetical protein
MDQNIWIEVIDKDGWRKEYPLDKSIVHIGSAPGSDLVLESGRGAGVAPLHAQLLILASGSGCQLVNLGDTDISLGLSGDQSLLPHSVTRITDGAVFKVGDFTLTLHGGAGEDTPGVVAGSSAHIGLNVSLPRSRLAVGQALTGVITVSNLGDQTGVQFDLELEGIEADCYSVEAGPLLSSGAEREVSFQLFHRGNRPLAGERRITIRAAAPLVYPGEQASVSRAIQVLPSYDHALRVVPPVSEAAGAEQKVATAGAVISPPQVETGPPAPDQVSEQDWWEVPPQAIADEEGVTPKQVVQAEAIAPPPEAVQEDRAEEPAEQMPEAEPSPLPQAEAAAAVEAQEPSPPGAGEPQEVTAPPPLQAMKTELPQVEVELPLPVEEQEAVIDIGDQRAEADVLPSEPPEVERVPQAGVDLPVKAEPVPAKAPEPEASPPPSTEAWWSPEATISPQDQVGEPQVLKLKASPPPDMAEESARPKASPLPEVEDWWSSDVETGTEEQGQAEEKEV